jgi:protein-S-isoprenylcysteine O-methyltransferase Ste14
MQGVAVGLMIGSSLVMVYSILGGIWWEVLVRWREEQHLEESFGEEYIAYINRVPCWWFRT